MPAFLIVLPVAEDIVAASKRPEAQGKNGYITTFRILSEIKGRNAGMYVATVLALKQLGYDSEALSAAVSMIG